MKTQIPRHLWMVAMILLQLGTNATAEARGLHEVPDVMKGRIAQDVAENFQMRLAEASDASEEEPVLSPKDQKVMLRTLYAGISGPLSLAGLHIDEKTFYNKAGKLLIKAAEAGVLPTAVAIGWSSRADLVVGKSRGKEMNFYLEDGKLRVSTYDLKTLNVGPAFNAKVGYYIALCFGACSGATAAGSYIGVDADLVYGMGTSLYIEVGVDTTDYYAAKKEAESYTLKELYNTKTVYLGVGMDIGLSVGFSMSLTDYGLMSDRAILDLYKLSRQPNYAEAVANGFRQANLFSGAPKLR